MEITQTFSLGLAPGRAYALLLDLEQVTPCLPGAELGEVREDGARAVAVTVKLGPMRFVYAGTIQITETDDVVRRAVLVGQARETRGQGTAKMTVSMTVSENGEGSTVSAAADVELTGRAAQMGGAVLEDVARAMIAEMASCLEARFARPQPAAPDSAGRETTPAAGAPPLPRASSEVRAGSLLFSILLARVKRLLGSGG